MRNGNLFWGAVLILLGVLMAFNLTEYFWPIALIVLGGWIIWGAYMRGNARNQSVSVDLQGAREVSLRIGHGAGQLRVGAGATVGKAIEGECSEGVTVNSRVAGDRLEVRLGADPVSFPFVGTRGLDWALRLSKDVPFALELETGANQSIVDLRDLRVTSLHLQTGASSTEVTLPASGQLTVHVELGAAEAKIRVPEGVAGRIRSQSGLAEININQSRFPYSNGIYESPDFGTSANRFDMNIEAGVGKVSVF